MQRDDVWVLYGTSDQNATDRFPARNQGTRRDEVQNHEMIDGIDCVPCIAVPATGAHTGPALSPCRDAGGCETGMILAGDAIASPVDAGTKLDLRETWYARFYRHNRQAGIAVGAAHAWHAMRTGHLLRWAEL